ncbi:hypothetical protein NDU88_007979 [Pleurodeles waltl]|uniref:Uncharacterized protein n=1 Tax=Pleurodeles waltl TaxID=8319 RepID=A0AAV7U1S7_PLEWA|nr:hypothetical protein NDU88_007975 [Pleurodeles waltl]KAJ1182802.1 hypothetical protein NDU88_007979 [Pleurodeles waltl]
MCLPALRRLQSRRAESLKPEHVSTGAAATAVTESSESETGARVYRRCGDCSHGEHTCLPALRRLQSRRAVSLKPEHVSTGAAATAVTESNESETRRRAMSLKLEHVSTGAAATAVTESSESETGARVYRRCCDCSHGEQ